MTTTDNFPNSHIKKYVFILIYQERHLFIFFCYLFCFFYIWVKNDVLLFYYVMFLMQIINVRIFVTLQVIEGCSVSGIQVERNMFGTKQISAVKTPFGTIKTECVVNCAGTKFAHATISHS